jgi:hypothetical protein
VHKLLLGEGGLRKLLAAALLATCLAGCSASGSSSSTNPTGATSSTNSTNSTDTNSTNTAATTNTNPGTGTGTTSEGPGSLTHAGDAQFCSSHSCIPSFSNGNGAVVQCVDGEWSHSGGLSGACSDHGGEG